MKFPADARRRFTPVQLAAAEWLILRDNGLSPARQREFEAWLAADPAHAQAFAGLQETWNTLDRVRELPPASAPLDPDAMGPQEARRSMEPRPKRGAIRWQLGFAAALMAVLAGGTWQPRQLAKGPSGDFSTTAETRVGDLRMLHLPDGSLVRLNTDSSIEVQYSKAERRVRLSRGEAHFTVAKHPDRPFVVRTGGVDVVAVGTAFNIRLRPEAVEVLVTEGRVRVNDAAKGESLLALAGRAPGAERHELASGVEPAVLQAGERLLVSPTAAIAPAAPVVVSPDEVERSLAWQARRLSFVAEPLGEIVAEFNRYNTHQLVVSDPRLAAKRFGGTFRAGGHETLVHLLERNHGVIAERRGTETILRLP